MNPPPIKSKPGSKTQDDALTGSLKKEFGLSEAQCRRALQILKKHLRKYYPNKLPPGTIIYKAICINEPPEKPAKYCKFVPIKLTIIKDADLTALRQSSVGLRKTRIYRFCHEAKKQGALLSYEDLKLLLGVDITTVKNLVHILREEDIYVPTRGRPKKKANND